MPDSRFLAVMALCALMALGAACTTIPNEEGTETIAAGETDPLRASPAESFPRISLSLDDATLGQAVRQMAERHGGSLALLNGIESRPLGRVALNQAAFDRTIEGWARQTDCAVQKTPNYYFVYPPGYEALTELSLIGDMHPRYDAVREPIIFGAGMSLYILFKWMGEALHLTIVGDNIIGDAACGEITMGRVPLAASLEALLKSARIAGAYVDSTEDYIFIAQPRAWPRRPTLLNAAGLSERQRAYLDARVTLRLPEPRRTTPSVELNHGAVTLGQALPVLSSQLGISVVCEPEIQDLPVNPIYLHDIPVRTAMDLLIWQWPLPEFGYQFTSNRLVIRRLSTAEIQAQREAYLGERPQP